MTENEKVLITFTAGIPFKVNISIKRVLEDAGFLNRHQTLKEVGKHLQDYVAILQWRGPPDFDPRAVRKPAAMPMCQKYTVETQMMGRDIVGCVLQFEILPARFDPTWGMASLPGPPPEDEQTPQIAFHTCTTHRAPSESTGASVPDTSSLFHDKDGHLEIMIYGDLRTAIHCSPSDLVEDVKNIVYEKQGIPPRQQRLVFQGKVLADDRTLASHNIHNVS